MVPEEGYVMHRRLCCSAMARWSNTSDSPSGAQPLLCHDSLSDESMHVYARGTGLEMPIATDLIAESLLCGGELVTLNAVRKGAVA
jgi:hypothetical protein